VTPGTRPARRSARAAPLPAGDRVAAFICLTVVAMVQILLNKTAAEIGAAHPRHSMPPSVSGSVSGLRPCWRGRAPCRRFGAPIASAMGEDKKPAPGRAGKKNAGAPSAYGLPPAPSL